MIDTQIKTQQKPWGRAAAALRCVQRTGSKVLSTSLSDWDASRDTLRKLKRRLNDRKNDMGAGGGMTVYGNREYQVSYL